jgi:hypothetical protein
MDTFNNWTGEETDATFTYANFYRDYTGDTGGAIPYRVEVVGDYDEHNGTIIYEDRHGEEYTATMSSGCWTEPFPLNRSVLFERVMEQIPSASLEYWINYNYEQSHYNNDPDAMWLDEDGEEGRRNLTPDGRRTDDL